MNVKDVLNYTVFKIVNGHLYMVTPDKTIYPNGIDEYQYPRYSAPITSITSSRVLTHTIDVDHLILGGVPVDDITYDVVSNDIYTLVTSKALYDNVKELSNRISDLDPHNVLYQDNSVVTLPIADTSFNTAFWDFDRWDLSRGSHAIFTATGTLIDISNYIRLKGHPFTRYGTYFINIEIENLDSGKLCIYDESNNLLNSTIVSGRFGAIYRPLNPDSANVTIKAENVLANEFVIISSISIYYVTTRIQEYLDFIVPYILSGESDYATTLYVERSLEAAKAYVNEVVDRLPDFSVMSSLQGHMVDRITNPHGITCDMIGASEISHTHDPRNLVPPAALEDHSHLPIDLGAADRDHTHTPDEIGAAQRIHTHTATEIGAALVDHTHTPNQCGAAPVVHTHEPEECGAAPVEHSHNLDDLGASPADHTHVPEDIGAADRYHTHIPSECGAAPADHTHTVEELGIDIMDHNHDPAHLDPPAAYANHTHMPEDINAADRDHTHNPEDLGAALIDHTHDPANLNPPAAYAIHTHLPEEIGAAPIEHTHSLNDLDKEVSLVGHTHDPAELDPPAALADHTHLPIDINAADRIHSHSLEDLGAAPIIHTHNPEDIGAAPVDHTHSLTEFGVAAADHTHDPYDLEPPAAYADHIHTPEEIGAAPVVHSHTPEEIGAALAEHTHLPEDIGAADLNHTHNPEDIGAAPIEHTHNLEDLGAAPVDHTHTADEIGAADRDHTHMPEDIGAANSYHTHIPEDIGAADRNHTHTLEELEAASVYHTHNPEDIGAAPLQHEHDEYLRKDDLQDTLSSELYSTHFKMSRISGTYIPGCINQIPYTKVPLTVISCYSLMHAYNDNVDPTIGYAYTNTACADNTQPWYAFYTPSSAENKTFISFEKNVSATDPIVIGYRFFSKKSLVSYSIERLNVESTIISWTITNEFGEILDEQSGVTWNNAELKKNFELTERAEVTNFIINITESSNPVKLHLLVNFIGSNNTDEESDEEPSQDLIYHGSIYIDGKSTFSISNKNICILGTTVDKSFVSNVDSEQFDNYSSIYVYSGYDETTNIVNNTNLNIVEFSVIPPEYGYTRQGIPLFSNFINGTGFGSIKYKNSVDIEESESESGDDIEESIDPVIYNNNISKFYNNHKRYELFDLNDRFVSNDTNIVTVIHENLPEMSLNGWTCFIDSDSMNNLTAPTSLEIQYIRRERFVIPEETIIIPNTESESGNESESGYTEIIPKPTPVSVEPEEIDDYHDKYKNEILKIIEASESGRTYIATTGIVPLTHQYNSDSNFVSNMNHVVFDKPISNIIKIKYIFRNANGTSISFAGMCPLFTGDFFNIKENIMYDNDDNLINNRIYLGICKSYKRYDNIQMFYPIITPIGIDVDIPLDVRPEEYTEIEIPNVFFTEYVEINPVETSVQSYTYIDNGNQITCHCLPSVKIKEVTPEKISMIAHGTRAIKIHRLW